MKKNALFILAMLAVALLAVGGAGYWLWTWQQTIDATNARAAARSQEASKRQAQANLLAAQKELIAAVHLRFIDSTAPPPPIASIEPQIPGVAPRRPAVQPVDDIRQVAPLRDEAGLTARPGEISGNDRSRAVKLVGRSEFHRLMPPLAAVESSFPLVLIDELVMSLPAGTRPFSTTPVALDVAMNLRVPLRLETPAAAKPLSK